MSKILTGVAFLLMLFLFVNVVYAETIDYEDEDVELHFNNSEAGFVVDIKITGKDVEVREDLYGTTTGSGPEDFILAGAEFDHNSEVREICYQPSLQEYFSQIGDIPPSGFAAYLKALGYDDESHVSFIWNLCQQEYINQQEAFWSADSGVKLPDMLRYITGAIDWLLGGDNNAPDTYKQLGTSLDSYFASDADLIRSNQILSFKIQELMIRIEALEKTMERTNSEVYCEAKKEALVAYDLDYIKCGENSTIYANLDPEEYGGFDMIGYTTEPQCEENWECTLWEKCEGGQRERVCADINQCGTTENKPAETQACVLVIEEPTPEPEMEDALLSTQENMSDLLSSLRGFLLPLFVI